MCCKIYREIKLLSLRKVYNEIVITWRSPNVTKSAINRSERTLTDIYVQRAYILVNELNTKTRTPENIPPKRREVVISRDGIWKIFIYYLRYYYQIPLYVMLLPLLTQVWLYFSSLLFFTVSFCIFFPAHETIYTIRVSVVFDFYYRT